MEQLLFALGRENNIGQQLSIPFLFGFVVSGFLIAGQTVYAYFHWSALAGHIIAWAVWFAWQGWLFPRRREQYLRNFPEQAYRQAFYRDILPGVSFGVSQMLRPAFFAFLIPSSFPFVPWQIIAGLGVVGLGISLLYLGFRTIGIAGAGFVYEYREAPPILIQRSIYTYIRHPLFLGGVIASFGLSLAFGKTEPIILALLNIAILPVYALLEDARLTRVFGKRYADYCTSANAFIPKLSLTTNLKEIIDISRTSPKGE